MRRLFLGLAILSALFPFVFFAGLLIYAEAVPSKWDYFEKDSSATTLKAPNPNPAPAKFLGHIDKLVYKDPWWAGAFWPLLILVITVSFVLACAFLVLYYCSRLARR